MPTHSENLSSKKAEILSQELLPSGFVDLYNDIFRFQESLIATLSADAVLQSVPVAGNHPLINPEKMRFSDGIRTLLASALSELCSLVSARNNGLDFHVLNDLIEGGGMSPEQLAVPVMLHDIEAIERNALKTRLGIEVYVFIVQNWLRPFMAVVAEKYGDSVDDPQWQENRCPVCGSLPDISMQADSLEGKRILHCSICEHRWTFPRITCTVCGNDDSTKLGYFDIDGDERYRLHYCEQCRGYIKVVRVAKFHSPDSCDAVVENIVTAFLDSSAMDKGYLRP